MEHKRNAEHGTPVTRREAMRLMAGTVGAWAGARAIGQDRRAVAANSPAADWDSLQGRLQGRVVSAQDAEYERDRQSMLRNVLKPDRFPDAIVYVASEKDVQEAVRFARKRRIKVAIRGGGHSFCGSPLRQGGLLLDLSQLNAVQIDPVRRQAIVQPVVRDRDFTERLASHGLAFPVGHCATVPMSGYLLNGGIGWNSNVWGPACMSVKGIELVNAEGESIYADPEQNADYYWAARGAGPGFFGVVTRYHLQLYPLPPVISTSSAFYRLEDAERVAEWLPELVRSLPAQVELNCFIVSSGPAPQEPSGNHPQKLFIVTAAAFADTQADARRWLLPVAEGPQLPERRQELNREAPFASLYELTGHLFLENRRYAADAFTSNAPPREILARLYDQILAAPSPESFILLSLPAPRPADTSAPPDMAFSLSGSAFVGLYSIWRDPVKDAENQQWVRRMGGQLEPIKVGHYIGETDLSADADRARLSFAAANWQRLQRLRRKYDPYDVFFDYLRPS